MTTDSRIKIINLAHIVIFQLGWLISAIFGDVCALIYSAFYLAFHFTVLRTYERTNIRREILWLLIFVVSGFFIETLFFSVGFLYFEGPFGEWNGIIFPPIWLLCLWLLFGITMRTSMSFLFNKLWLAFLLIIIFIPASYFIGASLNSDVTLGEPHSLSLAAITTLWVGFFGFLLTVKHFHFGDMFNDR